VNIEVIVEIPQGSRNKYEMDHKIGRIRLDRMLFTSTRYPLVYGFVPGTLAEDGDPSTLWSCSTSRPSLGACWSPDR